MSPTPKREEAPVAVKDGGIAPITLACISEEERDDAFCIMSGQLKVKDVRIHAFLLIHVCTK